MKANKQDLNKVMMASPTKPGFSVRVWYPKGRRMTAGRAKAVERMITDAERVAGQSVSSVFLNENLDPEGGRVEFFSLVFNYWREARRSGE